MSTDLPSKILFSVGVLSIYFKDLDISSVGSEANSHDLDDSQESGVSSFHESENAPSPVAVASPHLNPNWLRDLKTNFSCVIIEKLSQKVKDAVQENRNFENDKRGKRETRQSIIYGVLDYIIDIFGGIGRPKLAQMREIATQLAHTYPAMFRDDEDQGYGMGGRRGIEGLAQNMLDMLRGRQGSRKAPKNRDPEMAPKKGKRKLVYGTSCFFSV